MKKVRNKVTAAALCLLLLFSLAACGNPPDRAEKQGISVVATIFPVYDWLRELTKGVPDVSLTLLLDNGADLHNFQPTATDIVRIADCDLFVYVGGESDAWVADALKEAVNPDLIAVNLLDYLGDRARAEEEELESGEEEDEDEAYDEHVWLSLRNADVFCGLLAGKLTQIDAPHAETYAANAEAYREKLAALDERYTQAVLKARTDTLIFADRFPFLYLLEDYGLKHYAAFSGCSAEIEASFETVISLAEKLDELGLKTIFETETARNSLAETVRRNTRSQDQTIRTLHSMQSVTGREAEAGASYLSIMEQNLEVLQAALQNEE